MDYTTLRAIILSGPLAEDCASYVVLPGAPKTPGSVVRGMDQTIADIVNAAGVFKVIGSRPIGIGTVLDALGPTDGAAVLDALYTLAASARPIHYALMLLERGELDVGLASTRAQIAALVGGPITADQAAALLALAESPEPVSAAQVSVALRGGVDYVPGE